MNLFLNHIAVYLKQRRKNLGEGGVCHTIENRESSKFPRSQEQEYSLCFGKRQRTTVLQGEINAQMSFQT